MTAGARVRRGIAAATISVALLVLIARASATPLPYHGAQAALLRLSWTARPERIEVCRAVGEKELEEREEHMRQRVECDGRFATYALTVVADGRTLVSSVVRGAGLRHDRPLYLFRETSVTPGTHHIRVTFTRRERTDDDAAAFAGAERRTSEKGDTGIFAGRARREAEEHARRARAAIPKRLVLDTTLVFAPGRAALVSFDVSRRVLTVIEEAGRP
jgi:hypothetical protein